MSITTLSNRQSGWLPVLIAVATGTGGTETWRATVTGPVCQPLGQAAGVAEALGLADADEVRPEVGCPAGDPAVLDGLEPCGVDVVEHEAVPVAAAAITASIQAGLRYLGRRMGVPPGARAAGAAAAVIALNVTQTPPWQVWLPRDRWPQAGPTYARLRRALRPWDVAGVRDRLSYPVAT